MPSGLLDSPAPGAAELPPGTADAAGPDGGRSLPLCQSMGAVQGDALSPLSFMAGFLGPDEGPAVVPEAVAPLARGVGEAPLNAARAAAPGDAEGARPPTPQVACSPDSDSDDDGPFSRFRPWDGILNDSGQGQVVYGWSGEDWAGGDAEDWASGDLGDY